MSRVTAVSCRRPRHVRHGRPSGNAPADVTITPDGTRAYVTNLPSNTVSMTDTNTNTVIDTITVGNGPGGIAITPLSCKARKQVTNTGTATGDGSTPDTATIERGEHCEKPGKRDARHGVSGMPYAQHG
ncbi:hypothetical protein ABZ876_05610 [Streptomyces sp. NPDC046931]|uniref:hypothetical protein n=1 Tax=Streptomyces sp. NPDC046931 TaxID=3154806 RepID=UPI0033E0762F